MRVIVTSLVYQHFCFLKKYKTNFIETYNIDQSSLNRVDMYILRYNQKHIFEIKMKYKYV